MQASTPAYHHIFSIPLGIEKSGSDVCEQFSGEWEGRFENIGRGEYLVMKKLADVFKGGQESQPLAGRHNRIRWRRAPAAMAWWLRGKLRRPTTGGGWGDQVTAGTRQNMRSFLFAGVAATVQSGIILPYLSLYLLALGATSGQIGLMASLAGLLSTLLLIPGAMVAERSGKRKLIFMICGAGFSRLVFLPVALIPLLAPPATAVFLIILLRVLSNGVASFSTPAWTSLVGDLIPMHWRGRYFGSRTLFMTISSMVTTYLVGVMISGLSGGKTPVLGYEIAFGIAFAASMVSSGFFWRIKEPLSPATIPHQEEVYHLRSWLQTIAGDQVFRNYTIFGSIWNLAIGFSAPYFTLYMVEVLKANANDIGIFTIASSLAALPALNLFGILADRWGEWKVQLATGLLIPLLPLAWVLVRIPLHGTLINIPGGILWAGFNLASFNFLLSLAPSEKRARYSALFQVAVALSSAVGTLIGSLVVSHWGYIPVFVMSGVGRFIGIGYFGRYVRKRKSA